MRKILTLCCLLGLCWPAWAQAASWKAVLRYDKQTAQADLIRRLQKYTALSNETAKGRTALAKWLAKELKNIGAQQVKTGADGSVSALLPATTRQSVHALALGAFLPPGPGTEARLQAKYNGGDLWVDKAQNLRLTEYDNPQLLEAHGHDLLLAPNADGRAGAAVLLTLADYLLGHPAIAHGPIYLFFMQDPHAPAPVQAEYAYVLNGGRLGEMVTETFSGQSFEAVFEGDLRPDPGQAMGSAFADNRLMAADFQTLLPRQSRPENTSGRRGFVWVTQADTRGAVSTVRGIVRAFDAQEMQQLTAQVQQAFQTVKALNPKNKKSSLQFKEEFQNLQGKLPPALLSSLQAALRQEEIPAQTVALRAQNTAAALTAQGLPALELFCGVFNRGTPLEYADVSIMEAALRTLLTRSTL